MSELSCRPMPSLSMLCSHDASMAFLMLRQNKTYSECKNCAFRIRCSRLSASTIAYLYISLSDNGVVFFDANFRSSSISTPTVFSDIEAVVSNGLDNIDIVSSDVDDEDSLGFVGSAYDERDNDDETMGLFHPEAVGFLFLEMSG